jgi:25S rRNA (cytosine2278-C5)-methyltransferase
MIRCSPGEDATNGFFVSAFVRADHAKVKTATKRKAESDLVEDHTISCESGKKKRKKKRRTVTIEGTI